MSTIYEKIGLKKVVNASGRMTALGVSTPEDEIMETMKQAAQNYVVIDDLLVRCGELIAEMIGCEGACVASNTSAAITLCCAAAMTSTDMHKITRLPDTTGLKNEFILQGGHNIHFGTAFEQLIRVAGGKPVIAGQANLVHEYDVEGCINENTAALIYVKSHHCVQKGMLSLEKMIEIAHKHDLPLIMDASAEEDINVYDKMGVDMVCYSGSKAICGPTSSFVCGKKKYTDAVLLQYKGFGRVMKVGKENAMGLVKAIDLYLHKDFESYQKKQVENANYLLDEIKDLPGIQVGLQNDEAGRPIVRVKVQVLPSCKLSATEIVDQLKDGDPSIHIRAHNLNLGIFMFDFRPVSEEDVKLISKRMKEILQ